MKAPYLESKRGITLMVEIQEEGQGARLVARRFSIDPGDALGEVFIVENSNTTEFLAWARAWLSGDGTYSAMMYGRELDTSKLLPAALKKTQIRFMPQRVRLH